MSKASSLTWKVTPFQFDVFGRLWIWEGSTHWNFLAVQGRYIFGNVMSSPDSQTGSAVMEAKRGLEFVPFGNGDFLSHVNMSFLLLLLLSPLHCRCQKLHPRKQQPFPHQDAPWTLMILRCRMPPFASRPPIVDTGEAGSQ